MIKQVPQRFQAPIQRYFETGDFKHHTKEPMDRLESVVAQGMGLLGSAAVIATDDTAVDANKNPGAIELNDDQLGPLKAYYNHQAENGLEGFLQAGEENSSSLLYVKSNENTFDLLMVSDSGESDGAIHVDNQDPSKSFATAGAPEQLEAFFADR